MMKYNHTHKEDLIKWADDPREGYIEASAKKFIEGLTENVRLTNILQWLFANCSFCELESKIEHYTKNKVDSFNTYNWCSNSSNILQGINFTYDGERYCALQIHFGGDARGNYSDVVVFEGSFYDAVEDFSAEPTYIEIEGNKYACTPSIVSEEIDVYCSETDVEFQTYHSDKDDMAEFIRDRLNGKKAG